MKRFILLSLVTIGLAACNNSTETQQEQKENKDLLSTDLISNPRSADSTNTTELDKMPVISFQDTVYNFGILHEGEKVQHDFAFTNTGKSPLLISGANASCGCTLADYPKDPIAPGKGGVLKVNFNSANKEGVLEKTVAVYTNTEKGVVTLRIQADVKK